MNIVITTTIFKLNIRPSLRARVLGDQVVDPTPLPPTKKGKMVG